MSYKGRLLSVTALVTSWGFSLWAVYSIGFDLDMAAMWVAAICITEASKFFANDILWTGRAPKLRHKTMCAGWYAVGVGVSVYMLHSYVESRMRADSDRETQHIQHESSARDAQATRYAEARADLKEAESELEAARTAIVPLTTTATALEEKRRERLSAGERRDVEADLLTARTNAQQEGKIVRLTARVRELKGKVEAERPKTSQERPASGDVRDVRAVRYVRDDLSLMAYGLAIVLELAICGGIWRDARHNAPPPPPPPISNPQPATSVSLTPSDHEFEKFMFGLWKTKRGQDGWLEGTNQGWAELAGVTSRGFVHAQLKRMEAENKIEVRRTPRKTFVRFIQIAKLKVLG